MALSEPWLLPQLGAALTLIFSLALQKVCLTGNLTPRPALLGSVNNLGRRGSCQAGHCTHTPEPLDTHYWARTGRMTAVSVCVYNSLSGDVQEACMECVYPSPVGGAGGRGPPPPTNTLGLITC